MFCVLFKLMLAMPRSEHVRPLRNGTRRVGHEANYEALAYLRAPHDKTEQQRRGPKKKSAKSSKKTKGVLGEESHRRARCNTTISSLPKQRWHCNRRAREHIVNRHGNISDVAVQPAINMSPSTPLGHKARGNYDCRRVCVCLK